MSGKPNTAWMKAMVKKHGSEEAVREFMRAAGRKGGRVQTKKGFALMDRERLSEVSRKGGKKKAKQRNK